MVGNETSDEMSGCVPISVIRENEISNNSDKVEINEQVKSVVEQSSIVENGEKAKTSEKTRCCLQEEDGVLLVSSSSSYVPSSQTHAHVVTIQPLEGLIPEELFLSWSEGSQPRESSEESYSILHGGSAAGGEDEDVSFVPSSQNSHELDPAPQLPHVTPVRCQRDCSLSESQLEKLFENSVSFDEVTTPPGLSGVLSPTPECYTQIKPQEVFQEDSETTLYKILSGRRKCSSQSFSSRRTDVNTACYFSCQEAEKESSLIFGSKPNILGNTNSKESTISSSRGNSVSKSSTGKQPNRVNSNVEFDTLFSQNTWSVSQPFTQELSADLVEIDRRHSIKRRHSETEDHSHKTHLSDKQEKEVFYGDGTVSLGE